MCDVSVCKCVLRVKGKLPADKCHVCGCRCVYRTDCM